MSAPGRASAPGLGSVVPLEMGRKARELAEWRARLRLAVEFDWDRRAFGIIFAELTRLRAELDAIEELRKHGVS